MYLTSVSNHCLGMGPILIFEPLPCPENGWVFIWCLGFLFAWAFIIQKQHESTSFFFPSKQKKGSDDSVRFLLP